jgi:hypothetical protein
MFSLVSSLVLMAVAGVLSVSMAYVPYLVAWAVAAAASLVLAHRSELRELPGLAAPSGVAGRPARAHAASTVRPVLAVLGFVVGLGTVVFLVLPPAGAPARSPSRPG